jgi:hypothetical protein
MATAKYSPFGNSLDPSVAIIQAANALDVAAMIAQSNKDTDTMIRVAREWVEISGRLGYHGEEDDEEGEDSENCERRSFGFSVTSDIEEEEEVDGTVSEC